MVATDFPRLAGDIGGTHARFALQSHAGAPLQGIARYRCDDFETPAAAIHRYLAEHAPQPPQACAIGVATPVTGDRIALTNHPWVFSVRELRAQLGVQRLQVLNDFAALALSLTELPAADCRGVGGGQALEGAPIALLGPGTGLGVSGLLPVRGGRPLPIAGEGGHVTLAASNAEEAAVLAWLQRRFGHVSAERVLSGQGLENLAQALAEVEGTATSTGSSTPSTAAEITSVALERGCPRSLRALGLFCAFLGSVAGNLALTLGARGGVFVGGGIVPRLGAWFDSSPFRARFEAKGRFEGYLREIPTLVITSDVSPALIGALRGLDGGIGQAAVAS